MRERTILRYTSVAELYRSGKTQEEIGVQMGCTRQRVQQILKAAGLDRNDGWGVRRSVVAEARKLHKNAERDAHYLEERGMRYAEFKRVVARHPNAFRQYGAQRSNAARRGIAWEMDFATWWRIWEESGKFGLRGRGGYCMARNLDLGAYRDGNVYICTVSQNFSDSYITKPWHVRFPEGHPAVGLIGSGRGWTKDRDGKYNVRFRGKYIGRCFTTDEATELYKRAVADYKENVATC